VHLCFANRGGLLTAPAGHQGAVPMGPSARPEEVAAALTFLDTPRASSVTDQYLVADGGNSVADECGPLVPKTD